MYRSLADHSDKERTCKFVSETQAMIDNDSNKSISSTAKDIEMSEFLIRLVVHEDI